MEYPQLTVPEAGKSYLNRNGNTYRCIQVMNAETAVFVRELDGWTLTAHRTRQYADGRIEWDHSTDGHWPGGVPLYQSKRGQT